MHYVITDPDDFVLRVDETDGDAAPFVADGETAEPLEPEDVVPWPQEAGEVLKRVDGAFLVVQTLPLADLKERKWEALKAERSVREFGGFVWDGSAFDSDPASQARLQGAVLQAVVMGDAPFSIDWTLADNSVRTLSGADVVNAGLALATHVSGLYVTGRALRQLVEDATDAAELAAIVWP